MSRKRHLRSNTNLLLGSLALSDLLTGLVSVPLFITCNIVRQSAICVSEEQMSRFISASIVSHLMSVTVDRYLAILHPLRYTSLVTRPNCVVVILFIWLLSTFTALVQFTWLDPIHHDVRENPTDEVAKVELAYDIVFLTFFFFLPFALMSFTYAYIIIEITRQSRNIRKHCVPGSEQRGCRASHKRKAVPMFASMLLVYVVCWLPYFGLRRLDVTELPIPLVYVIVWLRFVASLFNPCIYIIGKRDFRKVIFHRDAKRGHQTNLTSVTKPIFLQRETFASHECANGTVLEEHLLFVDGRKENASLNS
ncbi:histamine H2 receptor-like [Montipora foliosa]|uniref:histamine H2 receptor-like n=1 Tax=Montipora foliosa TaxID=591990 RepID=UPI0035F191EB